MAIAVSDPAPGLVRRFLRAIAEVIFRPVEKSAGQLDPAREPPGGRSAQAEPYRSPIRDRLVDEMAVLQRLDAERESRRDSRIGKNTEDRIVWGELIELELQELDEQVGRRILGAAGLSNPTAASNLSAGGSHERNDS